MTDTTKEALQRPFFYLLVLLAGYLSVRILGPFLQPLGWAVILAIVFHGLQEGLASRIGPSRAAIVVTVMAGLLIVAPAVLLVSALLQEAPEVTNYLQQTSLTAPRQIERIWAVARAQSPIALPDDPTQLVAEGVQRVLAFMVPRASAIVADIFATLGLLVAMFFALFFMLRDGDRLSRQVCSVLPLPAEECERLMRDTRDLVIASVGAGLLVAVAQGTIGGIAFWLLGINPPVFWGVVIAFSSLIPVVGAALVWAPACLWLLLSGEIGRGVGMLLVGVLGISMADNILRPLLLSGRTSVSGFVIFFGLLGGVAAFGFIGLVIGPIILVTTGRLLTMIRDLPPEGGSHRSI